MSEHEMSPSLEAWISGRPTHPQHSAHQCLRHRRIKLQLEVARDHRAFFDGFTHDAAASFSHDTPIRARKVVLKPAFIPENVRLEGPETPRSPMKINRVSFKLSDPLFESALSCFASLEKKSNWPKINGMRESALCCLDTRPSRILSARSRFKPFPPGAVATKGVGR